MRQDNCFPQYGGEGIEKIENISADLQPICDSQRVCGVKIVDLLLFLYISLSGSMWNGLKRWIEQFLQNTYGKMKQKQDVWMDYALDAPVLFRVSVVSFDHQLFDVLRGFDGYDWGNQKGLFQNVTYQMEFVVLADENEGTTSQLS